MAVGVRSTYISATYLSEKEQRLHVLFPLRRAREGRRGVRGYGRYMVGGDVQLYEHASGNVSCIVVGVSNGVW